MSAASSVNLGPYQLLGELGRGAMAVVWRAYDPSVGREVAIKEPKIDDSLDPVTREELVTRFIREGRTAGQLNHPGIVTIYNAEVFEGRPVIVMELIEGETLSDLLRRSGRLPLAAAIGIAEQLLDALAYAHARGVVHRDIKPDNVFITDDGRVKLTDFGIAHVGAGTALTQAGTVMGTPGYMAPEQVRGEAVDARADLFSVGVMLYEMLAGANPFVAGDAHPTTIMYRVLNESLPDVRTVLPEANEGLAATVALSAAKDVDVRFATAEEMRRALLGEVAVAMPRVARDQHGRGRGVTAVAVIASLLVAGVFAWAFWPEIPDRTQEAIVGGPEASNASASRDASRAGDAGDGMAAEPSYEVAVFRGTELRAVDPATGDSRLLMSDPAALEGWDVNSGLESIVWDGAAGKLRFLGLSEGGTWVWECDGSGQVKNTWRETPFEDDAWPGANQGDLWALSAGAQGAILAIYGDGRVFDVGPEGEAGELALTLPFVSERFASIEVFDDGKLAAVSTFDDEAYIAPIAGGDPRPLMGDGGSELLYARVSGFCASPDGERLVAVAEDRSSGESRLLAFDPNGKMTRELYRSSGVGVVSGPAYSPDGDLLAFSIEGSLWLMNADGTDSREIADGMNACWIPAGWGLSEQ